MARLMECDERGGMDILLNGPDGEPAGEGEDGIPGGAIRMALGWLFEAEGVAEGEVSITFLDDADAQALNLKYLQHDWVPDVLSFPLAPPLVGDIYIGIGQARRQAEVYGVSIEEELVRLAIHGTLHLVGYDHPEDEVGRANCRMTDVQEALVERVRAAGGFA
jgi:probable rRNA maturation factor